jgi:glycosyltransferase involved in cell wall biosynthesis
VLDVIGNARALICPSQWYEGMPRVVIEAMAVGTPVIASRIGTYLEMIEHGKSGLLFEAGRPDALLACVRGFPSVDDAAAMRASARQQFNSYYSAEATYQSLIVIYKQAMAAQPTSDKSDKYVNSAARAA